MAASDCENMMKSLGVITKMAKIPVFNDAPLYLRLFKKRLNEKSDGSQLWLDDIETIARTAKSEIAKIQESMSHIIINCVFNISYILNCISHLAYKRYNILIYLYNYAVYKCHYRLQWSYFCATLTRTWKMTI